MEKVIALPSRFCLIGISAGKEKRNVLLAMARAGKLVMIESYHFDDQDGQIFGLNDWAPLRGTAGFSRCSSGGTMNF